MLAILALLAPLTLLAPAFVNLPVSQTLLDIAPGPHSALVSHNLDLRIRYTMHAATSGVRINIRENSMDISNLDAKGVVQELVNEGRLPNPVLFDNSLVRKAGNAPIVPPQAAHPNFDANSWSLGNASIVGGRMSKGIEKIRAQLLAQGNKDAATHLPLYYVGAFWMPPDAYKGWALNDPARYQLPTTDQTDLSPAQVEQIENNLQSWMNMQYNFSGLGANPSLFTTWRGENDGRGFGHFDNAASGSFSPSGATLSSVWQRHNVWTAPKHYTRHYVVDVNGNPTAQYSLIADSAVMTDHALFDRWWDVRTDENVVRYALSWLAAAGVSLSQDVNYWRT